MMEARISVKAHQEKKEGNSSYRSINGLLKNFQGDMGFVCHTGSTMFIYMTPVSNAVNNLKLRQTFL